MYDKNIISKIIHGVINFTFLSVIAICTGLGISITFVSASIINFLLMTIPILMCRKLLNYIPMISYICHYRILIHKNLIYYFYIFGFIHIISHYINLFEFNTIGLLYNPTVYTGNIIIFYLIVLFPILFWKKIREKWFFLIYHHLVFITFYILIISHGTFCFFKIKSSGVCRETSTWKWVLPSTLLLIFEYILRYMHKMYNIEKIVIYERDNTNIMSLNILKNPELEIFLGSTIYLNCPEISYLEWHPFTVVSTAYDIGYTTVFIKIRGDWTNQLMMKCGKISNGKLIESVYPKIIIDGPYNSSFKNIKFNLQNKVVCLYMSGIGITGFVSVFKYILNTKISLKELYIVISVRNFTEIDVIHDLIVSLSKIPNIKIKIYQTDKIKKVILCNDYQNVEIYYNRPDISEIKKKFNIEKVYKIGFN